MPLLLTLTVFLPAIGAILIALLPARDDRKTVHWTALIVSGLTLALTLVLFAGFDRSAQGYQFVDHYAWIPSLGISYYLGVDGLSLPLVVLNALLTFLAVLVSWRIDRRVKLYFSLLLTLETGVMGVFTALDLFLFFLFWEVELAPMYLLIAIWGSGRKEYSAMKFLIYTIAGSAVMLVGILILYFTAFPAGQRTFDMVALSEAGVRGTLGLILFWLLIFAFLVKLPVFPFHTWLPDAHVDAPTAVSVILAGILLKMGGYGMIRIAVGMFPEAAQTVAALLSGLAVVNILYGAAVSMAQKDLKKLVAYSSISSMGYALLGISSLTMAGLTGATLQMITHGFYSGMLFALVGVIYDRAHTREIAQFGGLAHRMPLVAVFFSIAGLAALGLPGLAPFVSEFLVFVGSFPVWTAATALAVFGVVLTAGYMLWTVERIFFGPLNERWAALPEATAVERIHLTTFTAGLLLIGLYPSLVTRVIEAGILPVIGRLGA